MNSLQDILGNKDFDKPPEVEVVKTFVRKRLNSDVRVTISPRSITIQTASSSLAGALRPLLYQLKNELQTDKKLYIRIG